MLDRQVFNNSTMLPRGFLKCNKMPHLRSIEQPWKVAHPTSIKRDDTAVVEFKKTSHST